jgi:WD40 repeat protein
MSPVRRASVVAAVALLFVSLLPCNADQADGTKPDEKKTEERIRPVVDKDLAPVMDAVADYIEAKNWDKVTGLLQKVISLDRDVRVPGGRVGVRAEARRILAGLPAEGRAAYEELYGQDAAKDLKEAREDEGKLTAVVNHYLYTDAGPAALEALAKLQVDTGRPRTAALYYTQLLSHKGVARWTPDSLFRVAAVFRQVGDAAHAEVVGKELLTRVGPDGLRVGDKKYSRDDLQEELSRPAEASTDWPLYGGDASRSMQGAGGVPFLVRQWSQPTNVLDDKARMEKINGILADAEKKLNESGETVLPAALPITATVTGRDGKKRSLAVYCTAAGLFAGDVDSGRLRGRQSHRGTLDWMLQQQNGDHTLSQWKKEYVDKDQRPGVFFENSTVNALSSDGANVYAVEDLAVPLPEEYSARAAKLPPGGPNPWGFSDEILRANGHNRLACFDLTRLLALKWVQGDDKTELKDSYFLGPPLPLDNRLYVLNQKEKELRLVCLDSGRGEVISVRTLAEMRDSLAEDPVRRTQAAHLAYADGVLVCPTNAGAIIGVDLATGDLAWVYRYKDVEAGWKTTAPMIADGKVVLAAPDSADLICLNLADGAELWTRGRHDDDLYPGGVIGGRVLVVGKKVCRGLNLATGETVWTKATGRPSGHGAAAGVRYYLPLKEGVEGNGPEICVLDPANGTVVSHVKSRDKDRDGKPVAPGNLVFADGLLLSQSATEIVGYPLLQAKLEEMTKRLDANPNDAQGLLGRGELRLEAGDLEGAVADLRKALENKPPDEERARAKLYSALTEWLRRDFKKAEPYLKDYEDLIKDWPDEAGRRGRRLLYHQLAGVGYEATGRPVEALRAYWEMVVTATDDDTIPAPDDPALRVRPDVWAKARVADLLKNADAGQRKQLDEEIDKLRKKLKDTNDREGQRRFNTLFGDTGPGREEGAASPSLWSAVALITAISAAPEERGRTDADGLPLPDGALARLGSTRFRVARSVRGLAYSPDGTVLAAAGEDGVLSLWDPATGKELRRLTAPEGGTSFFQGAAFSPDGKRLGEFDQNGAVRVWDLESGKPLARLDGDYCGGRLAFSPDGKKLAVCGGRRVGDKVVRDAKLWDATTGKELRDFGEADMAIAYSPDGGAVATCLGEKIFLWDPEKGERRRVIATGQQAVFTMVFASDGKALASVGVGNAITLWDPATGEEIRRLKGDPGGVFFIGFSADGKALVSRSNDNTYVVWDGKTGEKLRTVRVKDSNQDPIALSPDGKTAASGWGDAVRVWDLASGEEKTPPAVHLIALALSPDGKTAATGGVSGDEGRFRTDIQLWDAASGKPLRHWDSQCNPESLAFSPDGHRLAGLGAVWDVNGDGDSVKFDANERLSPPVFSPDGKKFVLAGAYHIITVDAATGKILNSAPTAIGWPYNLPIASPDGRFVAAGHCPFDPDGKGKAREGGAGAMIGLWDTATGKPVREFGDWSKAKGGQGVEILAFSHDGRLMASLEVDGTLHLWRPERGEEIAAFPCPVRRVQALAFSPDAKLLAVGGEDDGVRLLETATGKETCVYRGDPGGIRAAAFSADGAVLAAGGGATALVWDVAGRTLGSGELKEDELERLWSDLSGDPAKAFAARRALTAAPRHSVPFLLKRLAATAPALDAKLLDRLVAGLDADTFEEREAAAKELEALGERAVPALRGALAGKPSVEVRLRAERLLEKLADSKPAPDRLRIARAVAALECANAPEAKQALEKLAKGPEGAPETEEAKAALARRPAP